MVASRTPDGAAALEATRALAPQLAAAGDYGDRERRLPAALVDALAEAGLFRLLLPRAIGGGEVELAAFLGVAEAVAQADGSTGWCLVQGAISAAQVVACLAPSVARHIFTSDPHAVLANGTGLGGRVAAVEGGYRLSGEWAFASGCTHATWFKAAAPTYAPDGAPVPGANGTQEVRTLLFPASQAALRDAWQVSGLRGTGSHTIVVHDLFVPSERTVALADDPVREPGPLYRLPYAGVAACGFAAVALGLARGALDALLELARTKTPRGAGQPLGASPVLQAQVAQAEAQLRAARAFLFETVAAVWETASRGGVLPLEQRALLRLAATSGIHAAAGVVDAAYHAAGATAIFAGHGFERRFRDVHAVTQQTQADPAHFQAVGRVFLGRDPESSHL